MLTLYFSHTLKHQTKVFSSRMNRWRYCRFPISSEVYIVDDWRRWGRYIDFDQSIPSLAELANEEDSYVDATWAFSPSVTKGFLWGVLRRWWLKSTMRWRGTWWVERWVSFAAWKSLAWNCFGAWHNEMKEEDRGSLKGSSIWIRGRVYGQRSQSWKDSYSSPAKLL